MSDYMKPILRKKPEKVVLHIGTNNLRKGDAKSVADGIINLAQSIEQQCPDTEIIISGIISRSDVISFSSRVKETNESVKSVCNQKNWIFMPNKNSKTAHLYARGLHLNPLAVYCCKTTLSLLFLNHDSLSLWLQI